MEFGPICAESFRPELTRDGLVCLFLSSICVVYGSNKTHVRTLFPSALAYDTCSGFNVTTRSAFLPDYQEYIIPDAGLPRPAGASEKSLKLSSFVKLRVRLDKTLFRQPLVIAERVAVLLVFGVAFVDEHIRIHHIQVRELEFTNCGTDPVPRTFLQEVLADTRTSENKNVCSTTRSLPSDGVELSPVRFSELILFPTTM